MRTLLAALTLLCLILFLCFASGAYVANSCRQLLRLAKQTDSAQILSELDARWEETLPYLSLTVNRQLIAKAEKALSQMKAHPIESDFFRSAKTEFTETLLTIRSSYGLWLGSVI